MSDNRHSIGLVLTGGGARGAYQVGVLSAIAEALPDERVPFSVITGVSVGAINAASLTAGAHEFRQGVRKLVQLWQGLHSDRIYHTSAPRIAKRLGAWLASFLFGWAGVRSPTSLLDNEPLRALLLREIDFARLIENVDGPTLDALAITASSYEDGLAVAFYQGSYPAREWYRSRRVGRPTTFSVDHIMASSALPFVFPARQVLGEYFGDGALRQIAPLSPAIHLGAEKLFVIGARDKKTHGEPARAHNMPYPSLGQLSGNLMDIVFNDNLDADMERLARLNNLIATTGPMEDAGAQLKQIDLFNIQPSQDIRTLAGQNVHELPWTIRLILKSLGAWRDPWVLPSYLMFEPGYINALIDLGRSDATARMREILDFLEVR